MKKFRIVVNGEAYEVEVEEVGVEGAPVVSSPAAAPIARPAAPAARPAAPAAAPKAAAPRAAAPVAAGAGAVNSPMPGTILELKVKVGDAVKSGQPVLILEAMKMENEIVATVDGTVKDIRVEKGATVNSGDILVVIG